MKFAKSLSSEFYERFLLARDGCCTRAKGTGKNLTCYEAVVQAVELWNNVPAAFTASKLAHNYILSQAAEKYLSERTKERANWTPAKQQPTS